MLPKVMAAIKFVRRFPDKKAIITSLDKALDALKGNSGTVFTMS
jgi:carbamate kinase